MVEDGERSAVHARDRSQASRDDAETELPGATNDRTLVAAGADHQDGLHDGRCYWPLAIGILPREPAEPVADPLVRELEVRLEAVALEARGDEADAVGSEHDVRGFGGIDDQALHAALTFGVLHERPSDHAGHLGILLELTLVEGAPARLGGNEGDDRVGHGRASYDVGLVRPSGHSARCMIGLR